MAWFKVINLGNLGQVTGHVNLLFCMKPKIFVGVIYESASNCHVFTSFTVLPWNNIIHSHDNFLQGPPLSGKYDMGAICMQEHSEKLHGLVNDALDKGAEIVSRGSVGNIGEGAVDQYFPPTVIVNVNHEMKLMQEEVMLLLVD